MGNTETIVSIIDIINAGGVVAILSIVLFGFYSGKIISWKTHQEISERTEVVVEHLIEKINGSFEEQNVQQSEFIKRVDVLAQDYLVFQRDLRDGMSTMQQMNPQLLKTLQSIEEQLKKQYGE